VIYALCLAQLCTTIGVFTFPALLPQFIAAWSLSNEQAGWIAGLYFVAYATTAPFAIALTDRVDARYVLLTGALLAAGAAGGFALFADGFWSALACRTLAGAALAATYMPGLRVLIDRYRGKHPSRMLSFYTASFSLGTALSYLLAGGITDAFGWRAAFAATAAAALAATLIPLSLRSVKPPARPDGAPHLLAFGPVLRNRRLMGYILAYGAHCWELFAFRSWLVAFLSVAAMRDARAEAWWLGPTLMATLGGLVAMAASIGGNELCVRFGRRRVIFLVMIFTALTATGFGFSVTLGYVCAAALSLLYIALIQLDSAALTAGALESATQGLHGATLAVHAVFGFACAGVGPLLLGVALDGAAPLGESLAWGLAFASLVVPGVLGALALLWSSDIIAATRR